MNALLRILDEPRCRLSPAPELTPFIKWPGGKSQELPAIASAAPMLTGRYIDPFVGGGSVLLAVPSEVDAWANDAAEDLIALYRAAANEESSFFESIRCLAQAWSAFGALDSLYEGLETEYLGGGSGLTTLSSATAHRTSEALLVRAGDGLSGTFSARVAKDIPGKFRRMRAIERSVGRPLSGHDLRANIEGAVRSAFYMSVRARYNRARLAGTRTAARTADFYFLREFAYAAMFRFNSRGEFNVPYGGLTYNRKLLSDKVEALLNPMLLARLQGTTWRCADFECFLDEASPDPDDFVFADPPYDSDFSDYDNLPFGRRDQERLQQVLESLPANVMVVIKDTPMIRRLYRSDRWRISEADKTYMWTIKSRNDRGATHLTITNY